MKAVKRTIAIGMLGLALTASIALAQERTATKQGFELPANSGKTILLFRPKISVG